MASTIMPYLESGHIRRQNQMNIQITLTEVMHFLPVHVGILIKNPFKKSRWSYLESRSYSSSGSKESSNPTEGRPGKAKSPVLISSMKGFSWFSWLFPVAKDTKLRSCH